jgi:hypothetical protein
MLIVVSEDKIIYNGKKIVETKIINVENNFFVFSLSK